MKKALNAVVKIIVIIIAFILLTGLFRPKYIEKNIDGRIMAEYYREKTPIDVIFVGSSTVHSGFSPMTLYGEYGITSYCRSNSSQVIPISYAVIEDSIMRNKPELVVMDVGFLYNADDYVDEGSSRKSMDDMKWSKYKSDCIKAIMDPSENYLDYVFPILRFHSRWNDLSAEDFKYLLYKPDVTYNGQLLQFSDKGLEATWEPYNLDESILATEITMEYLQKIADTCNKNGVQLLLIKMPVIKGNWNRGIESQMADFASKNNIEYINCIDLYNEIGLDPSLYADEQHMNSMGAEVFTKYIGKHIVDNYSVSDRRNDPNVKKIFDDKMVRYNKAMSDKEYSEPLFNN